MNKISTFFLFLIPSFLCFGSVTKIDLFPEPADSFSLYELTPVSQENGYIAFRARISGINYTQAYIKNLENGETLQLSKTDSEDAANRDVRSIALSENGKYVVFSSSASNLGETSYLTKVFVYDTKNVSLSYIKTNDGQNLDRDILQYTLSSDGNYIVYVTSATNVIEGEVNSARSLYKYSLATESSELVRELTYSESLLDISSDGRYALVLDNRYCHLLSRYDSSNSENINIPLEDSPSADCWRRATAILSNDGNKVGYISTKDNVNYITLFDFNDSSTVSYELPAYIQPSYINSPVIKGISADTSKILIEGQLASESGKAVWLFNSADESFKMISANNDGERLTFPTASEANFLSTSSTFAIREDNQGYLINPSLLNSEAPAAVTNAVASSNEVAKISLSWDHQENFDGIYMVYRQLAGEDGKGIWVGSSYNNEFIDQATPLDINEIYTHTIESCNKLYVCASTTVSGGQLIAPEQVQNLFEYESSESNTRAIQWDPVQYASYKIKVQADFRSETIVTSRSTYSFNSYSYRSIPLQVTVAACINDVCGPESEPVRLDPTPSQAIEGLAYFYNDDFSAIKIAWEPNDYAVHYRVYVYDEQTQEYRFRQKVSREEFESSLTNLGDNPRFAVEACDYFDTCGSKKSINLQRLHAGNVTELAIPFLRITNSYNYFKLTSSQQFERYKLFRRSTRFGQPILIADTQTGIGKAFEYNDSDIEPEIEYFYFIEGCINNTCIRSKDVKSQALETFGTNIAKISDLTASSGEFRNLVRLSWSNNGLFDGGELYRDDRKIATLSAESDQYDDINVAEGVQYEYYIVPFYKERSSTRFGLPSNKVLGSTGFDQGTIVEPRAPNLRTTPNRFYDEIKFSWDRVSNADQYKVYFSEAADGSYTLLSTLSFQTSFTLRNLKPGTTLYFKGQSCTNSFCSELSQSVLGSTSVSDTAPVNAEAPSLSSTSGGVSLSYSSASGAVYYIILRKTSIYDTSEQLFTTDELSYLDTDVDSNKTYYYRVQACNPAGCSSPSVYAEIQTDVIVDSSDKETFRLYSTSATSSVITTSYQRENWGALSVDKINIYYSTSLGGEKTLLESHSLPEPYRTIHFEEAVADTSYYFWIESCYRSSEEENCETHRRYLVEKLVDSEAEIIPVPGIPQLTSGVNRIYADGWLANGTQVEFHISDTRDGDYRHASSTSSFPRSFSVTESHYHSQDKWIKLRQCVNSTCSEFSQPQLIKVLPTHTSALSTSNENIWNISTSFGYFLGKSAYNLGEQRLASIQQQFLGSDTSISFSAYLPATQDNYQNCTTLLTLTADLPGVTVEPETFFKIYRGKVGCSEYGFTDPTKLYFVLGSNYNNAIVKNAEQYLDQWQDYAILLAEDFNIKLNIDNTYIGEAKSTALSQLSPEFAFIQFARATYFGTYLSTVEVSAQDEFSGYGPNLRYLNSYDNRNSIRINVGKGNGENQVDLDIYPFDNDTLGQPHTTTFSSSTLYYFAPNTGTYLIAARECNGSLCSSAKYDLVTVSEYIGRPNTPTLTETGVQGQIHATWEEVSEATHYNIYGRQKNYGSLSLIGTSPTTAFTISGVRSSTYNVSVEACKNDLCGNKSSISSITLTFDSDGDGLTDGEEFEIGSDPFIADTDGDGISDYEEAITYNTNPLRIDSDGDGINDNIEISRGTDPLLNEQCPGFMCGNKYRGWRISELAN